jgi:hypothetical protein
VDCTVSKISSLAWHLHPTYEAAKRTVEMAATFMAVVVGLGVICTMFKLQ